MIFTERFENECGVQMALDVSDGQKLTEKILATISSG